MYLMAALNLARLEDNDTIQGIPTFNSTPFPSNLSIPGGRMSDPDKRGSRGISILLGGSNADAGCSLMIEEVDLVLLELIFLVVLGMWSATGGGLEGELPREEAFGRFRSDTSDPSRKILGSGRVAR